MTDPTTGTVRTVQTLVDADLVQASTRNGYGQFAIGPSILYAHRISWMLAHGPVPGGQHVLHRCDARPCVRSSHLFLGSNADNVRDRVSKGRQTHGESHSTTVLTLEQIEQIRWLAGTRTLTQRQIAKRFSISQGHVSDIHNGHRWGAD